MKSDDYQQAVDYFAGEIAKRLKRQRHISIEQQQSQMTDDLDAFCEDIAGEVSKTMGWD